MIDKAVEKKQTTWTAKAFAPSFITVNKNPRLMKVFHYLLRRPERGRLLDIGCGSFIQKFPFPSALFHVIFAGEVVEHTVDDDFFLKECYRILKKRGTLILTTPNLVSLTNRVRMALGWLPVYAYEDFHYRIYTRDLITRKIRKAGFTLDSVSASHIVISRYRNSVLNTAFGGIGEVLGTLWPTLGEQFIIYAHK